MHNSNKYQIYPEFQLPRAPSQYEMLLLEQLIQSQFVIDQILERVSQLNTEDEAGLEEKDATQICKAIFEISESIRLASAEPHNASSFLNSAPRFIDEIRDMLKKYQVELIDHTGESYPTSVTVEVLDWEVDPTVSGQLITETLEPTIYFQGKLLNRAKVIVTKNN